jgi:hypothetical protein
MDFIREKSFDQLIDKDQMNKLSFMKFLKIYS